jgi:hypothetical protein
MTNLAERKTTGGPAANPGSPTMENIDFDTPNEESMQLLEQSWKRFCGSIGLEEVPDIRAILAAHDAATPSVPRRHWLVRPFAAVYAYFRNYY